MSRFEPISRLCRSGQLDGLVGVPQWESALLTEPYPARQNYIDTRRSRWMGVVSCSSIAQLAWQ